MDIKNVAFPYRSEHFQKLEDVLQFFSAQSAESEYIHSECGSI